MSKYAAVIFNLSGVIVNDHLVQEEAFRQALSGYCDALTEKEWLRYFIGRTDAEGLRLFSRARRCHIESVSVVLAEKTRIYMNLMRHSIRAVPGSISFVSTAARGWPGKVALVTSADREEVELLTASLEVADCFAVTVTCEDFKHSKPNPEGYLLAARRLGVRPCDCLVFDDTPIGIAAAKAAGMGCIAVTTTHSVNALKGADQVVSRLSGSLLHGV